jgi:hypothetical protein
MDDLTFNTTRALPSAARDSAGLDSAAFDSAIRVAPALDSAARDSPAAQPLLRRRSVVRGPAVPRPLGGAGDLVVIIGLHDDALTVAESMAAAGIGSSGIPGDVALAGTLAPGYDPAWDRRRALGARARGVEREQSLFVAFGIGTGAGSGAGSGGSGRRALSAGGAGAGASRADDSGHTARLRGSLAAQADAVVEIGADQVWVAVDAGRKPEDTARWVRALAETLQIDAVAVVGSGATSSPETVHSLALPVGWVDGDLPLPATRRAAGVAAGATDAQARLV